MEKIKVKIRSLFTIETEKGKIMCFLNRGKFTEGKPFEILIFPVVYQKYKEILNIGSEVEISGTFPESADGSIDREKFIASEISHS